MVVVVVRRGKGEGEESDRGGSAVNAMAAMARSLSLSLASPPGPATGWPLWSGAGGLLSTLAFSLRKLKPAALGVGDAC
jgi:hypothetical protein